MPMAPRSLWVKGSLLFWLECLKAPSLSWWSEVASQRMLLPTVPIKVSQTCACLALSATKLGSPWMEGCLFPLSCNSTYLHCQRNMPQHFGFNPTLLIHQQVISTNWLLCKLYQVFWVVTTSKFRPLRVHIKLFCPTKTFPSSNFTKLRWTSGMKFRTFWNLPIIWQRTLIST